MSALPGVRKLETKLLLRAHSGFPNVMVYTEFPRNRNQDIGDKQESFYFPLCLQGIQACVFLFSTGELGQNLKAQIRGSDFAPGSGLSLEQNLSLG